MGHAVVPLMAKPEMSGLAAVTRARVDKLTSRASVTEPFRGVGGTGTTVGAGATLGGTTVGGVVAGVTDTTELAPPLELVAAPMTTWAGPEGLDWADSSRTPIRADTATRPSVRFMMQRGYPSRRQPQFNFLG